MPTIILNTTQIKQKIRRMAYQIYEKNWEAKEIILAGIENGGYLLAQRLENELKNITPFDTKLVKITLDKFQPVQTEVMLDVDIEILANKIIVLVDDVLNTGRTLAYSLRPFLKIPVIKLQTAVLVNRHHPSFPIAADYVGYILSTTLQDNIVVDLTNDENEKVYLS
ncbi:MAG: phosphoribosyltransferase [Bacteroidetes bacterium]|nr:MAG: phosphoribosyltransferase [Bacteroidota bacterium]TAG91775.1 MAG: phosphoribosyltransferase [Bacteroidota bacterium]